MKISRVLIRLSNQSTCLENKYEDMTLDELDEFEDEEDERVMAMYR